MADRIALQVVGLRARLCDTTPARRPALGDGSLLAVKALALVAAAAAVLSLRALAPALRGRVASPQAGVELRTPAGWRVLWRTSWGVAVREEEGGSAGPCEAFLMRLSWPDFEGYHRTLTGRSLALGWHDHEAGVLSAVAAAFSMGAVSESRPPERVVMGGRPAAMIASRQADRWTALVVAAGQDLAIAGVNAPTARDLDRVWRRWKAMVATAALPDPTRVVSATGNSAACD